jgi:hypothetical protein
MAQTSMQHWLRKSAIDSASTAAAMAILHPMPTIHPRMATIRLRLRTPTLQLFMATSQVLLRTPTLHRRSSHLGPPRMATILRRKATTAPANGDYPSADADYGDYPADGS